MSYAPQVPATTQRDPAPGDHDAPVGDDLAGDLDLPAPQATEQGVDGDGGDGLDALPAMTQELLHGAMEETSVAAAVDRIYANMFSRTGWSYNASSTNTDGGSYASGAADVGMCESYSHAFISALEVYDRLRRDHPSEAVRTGDLAFEKDESLAGARFVTTAGLTLMGATALRGNVHVEVDGAGRVVRTGATEIGRFVFKGHWYVRVNGKPYDPIFEGATGHVDTVLDKDYLAGDLQFFADIHAPVPTGEFGAQFVMLNDATTFRANLAALRTFHDKNAKDVAKAADSASKRTKVLKKLRKLLAEQHVSLTDLFAVTDLAYQTGKVPRADFKALQALRELQMLG